MTMKMLRKFLLRASFTEMTFPLLSNMSPVSMVQPLMTYWPLVIGPRLERLPTVRLVRPLSLPLTKKLMVQFSPPKG